ncbi:MAG: hypothetical protein GY730_02595 [bacterium]|nr:hypothetical protein [bacterium]
MSIKKRYPLALERMAKVHGPYMALNLSGYEWIWGQNGDENRIVKKGNPKIVLYNLKTYQFEKEIEGDFGPIAEKVDL